MDPALVHADWHGVAACTCAQVRAGQKPDRCEKRLARLGCITGTGALDAMPWFSLAWELTAFGPQGIIGRHPALAEKYCAY